MDGTGVGTVVLRPPPGQPHDPQSLHGYVRLSSAFRSPPVPFSTTPYRIEFQQLLKTKDLIDWSWHARLELAFGMLDSGMW